MKIGIIGVGNMGYQLVKNFLKAGVNVGIYDIDEEAVAKLVSQGAACFNSPLQLAQHYPYIITILPNAVIVKSVVLGDNGLLAGFHENSMLIEMSSSDPTSTKEIASLLDAKGFRMIDAPVSGGVTRAKLGTLTIMAGGTEEHVKEVLPLLNMISENVFHVGEIGAGHTMKALNNLISATTLAATAEALALGTKLGLKPSKMLEVINTSTGRSFSSEQKFPNQIMNRNFNGGFALDLMVKDLTIAMDIANRERAAMPISSASYQTWKQAWTKIDPKLDHTTVVKEIEESMNIEVKDHQ